MEHSDLAKFFGKNVIMNVNTSNGEFRGVEGRVQLVEISGLVVKTRSGSEVIELKDVIDIEEQQRPRRRRVIRRYVRVLDPDSNIRQHLADRHGTLVPVLNGNEDDLLFAMHEKIDHSILGHVHGERPPRQAVDPAEAEKRIDQLGEYADEDEEDEDELESV